MNIGPISRAMLMSAGLGTRLRPFTDSLSKPLVPVLGIPVAQFAVDSLVQAGVTRIVANIHHHPQKTMNGLMALDWMNAELVFSDESKLLLGSAGGIRHALHHFGQQPFFLANADVLCDVDWKALADHHQRLRKEKRVTMTLAVFRRGPAGGTYREIFYDKGSDLVTGLGDLVEGRPFFVGAAVLEPALFQRFSDGVPADFTSQVLRPAILSQEVGIFLSDGFWFDIGSPFHLWETHLSLIEGFEHGWFNEGASLGWRRRIEAVSRRMGPGIWISQGVQQDLALDCWQGPCYWNKQEFEDLEGPKRFGPSSILYGEVKGQVNFARGIGFGGQWLKF